MAATVAIQLGASMVRTRTPFRSAGFSTNLLVNIWRVPWNQL